MENQTKKETFHYTYSATEQDEIKRIRKKYMAPEEDKMELLRRLDRQAAQKGTVMALVLGIIGTLALGIGMCCAMLWAETWFVQGIVIGVTGIALICASYPLYLRITEKERRKIAPEILRLSEELLK